MINVITITVNSAMLLFLSNVAPPEPFCQVQVSTSERADLYHDPDGGCKALGEALKADYQKLYPSTPVVLIVDGKSNHAL